jgi:hypothetical protein
MGITDFGRTTILSGANTFEVIYIALNSAKLIENSPRFIMYMMHQKD